MVEEADFTNSPMASSFSSASLLVMPYWRASSETRVLATILLLATTRGRGAAVSGCCRNSEGCSSGGTHRVLMSCCSSPSCRSVVLVMPGRARGNKLVHRCRGGCSGETKCSPEGPAPHRERVALGRRVQVRPTTGCGGLRIGSDNHEALLVHPGDNPQQRVLGGAPTTADAGPRRSCRCARHQSSTLPRCTTQYPNGRDI